MIPIVFVFPIVFPTLNFRKCRGTEAYAHRFIMTFDTSSSRHINVQTNNINWFIIIQLAKNLLVLVAHIVSKDAMPTFNHCLPNIIRYTRK
jgi:hypothetical protein